MKRIRIAGPCLVAILWLGSLVTAPVSAAFLLHTFKECVKVTNGHYTSKECTLASKVETGGKYELTSPNNKKLLPGTEASFMSKSSTSTLYVYIPADEATPLNGGAIAGKVVCKSSSGKGKYVSEMVSESFIAFKTCTSEGKKCTSAGNPIGSITTFQLYTEPVLWEGKYELLTYAAAARKATQAETLAAAAETPSAIFTCEGLESITTNDVLGSATLDNQVAVKTSHDVLNVNPANGKQELNFFESEELGPFQAFLLAHVTPPGVTLPAGENTNQELKGKTAVGIYPS